MSGTASLALPSNDAPTGDIFERIRLLLLRLLQRDSTEVVLFAVRPGTGDVMYACAYVGEPPEAFAAHYKGRLTVQGQTPLELSGPAYRIGRGASATEALEDIVRALREGLAARIEADLGTWELATGAPWPGVAPVERVSADPVATPADELGGKFARVGRAALPPRCS